MTRRRSIALPFLLFASALSTPLCTHKTSNGTVTYRGIYRDSVEAFLGIPYAQDTGGENRFKPPQLYLPAAGSTIHATAGGPACPQTLGATGLPLYLGNITEISEDCLRLNIIRPTGTKTSDKLPVLVYIHGGGFISASKDDPVSQPGGMILQSIANGHSIIHASINYRLGIFGFAQSTSLLSEGSSNAGLRDQRLALEWIRDHISSFGGDPSSITIHGQSSGGLAVGMQILAYGASPPPPFQRAIAESQALEPGITGNFTRTAMARVLNATGCSIHAQDSSAAAACLRNLTMDALLAAQTSTHGTTPGANVGDEWLPVVDGDFLPDAPSALIAAGHVGNVSFIGGWVENDAAPFVDDTIATANDTRAYFAAYLPGFTSSNLDTLLDLYPVSEFPPSYDSNGTIVLTAEFNRAGRILRDILFGCQPILLGAKLQSLGNSVYFYDQNQTILAAILDESGFPGDQLGPVHTSELAYVFGNFSHYDMYGLQPVITPADEALLRAESRSWSGFVATGDPSVGRSTLRGWLEAVFDDENYGIYVIGGPSAGYGAVNGSARTELAKQKMSQRCGFLNQPDIVLQQNY
ncbi:Alpha/Beta hydrolase protein [Mycena epipterygia]|nr:Alpha/Beta hydrolase protein [Mycena epipterygia]